MVRLIEGEIVAYLAWHSFVKSVRRLFVKSEVPMPLNRAAGVAC